MARPTKEQIDEVGTLAVSLANLIAENIHKTANRDQFGSGVVGPFLVWVQTGAEADKKAAQLDKHREVLQKQIDRKMGQGGTE